MSAAEIPDAGGEFLLCYYSNNLQAIVGISQPFQVIHLEALINFGWDFYFFCFHMHLNTGVCNWVNSMGDGSSSNCKKCICWLTASKRIC